MPAETPEIPREILEELRLIGQAVHQISHDIHSLWETVNRHAPIADAYQRGGILAARTARKAAARDGQFQRRAADDKWVDISEEDAIAQGWGTNGR